MPAPIVLYSIRRNIDYGPRTFWTEHASCNRTLQVFRLTRDYSTTELPARWQHRLETLFPLRLRKLTQSSGHRDGSYAETDNLRRWVKKIRTTTTIITYCKMIRLFAPMKQSPPSSILIHMCRNNDGIYIERAMGIILVPICNMSNI